jgi:hypothetical protein
MSYARRIAPNHLLSAEPSVMRLVVCFASHILTLYYPVVVEELITQNIRDCPALETDRNPQVMRIHIALVGAIYPQCMVGLAPQYERGFSEHSLYVLWRRVQAEL